jgi:AAA domain
MAPEDPGKAARVPLPRRARGRPAEAALRAGDVARPDLPKPACRVKLICGPPAAGKSTYVQAHAQPGDIVIDLDLIARERGYNRARPSSAAGDLLAERNRRLAALAYEPPDRVAWIILGAPSRSLRQWWCKALAVRSEDLIVLTPSQDELQRRIMRDPDRRRVRLQHIALARKWYDRERNDNPGIVKSGVDADGLPLDPLHPWNRLK